MFTFLERPANSFVRVKAVLVPVFVIGGLRGSTATSGSCIHTKIDAKVKNEALITTKLKGQTHISFVETRLVVLRGCNFY